MIDWKQLKSIDWSNYKPLSLPRKSFSFLLVGFVCSNKTRICLIIQIRKSVSNGHTGFSNIHHHRHHCSNTFSVYRIDVICVKTNKTLKLYLLWSEDKQTFNVLSIECPDDNRPLSNNTNGKLWNAIVRHPVVWNSSTASISGMN